MAVYRKIYKSGNSVVISLPAWLLEQHGLEVGDYFIMKSSPGVGVQLTPASQEDKDRDRWSNKGIDRNKKREPNPTGYEN